jgi:N-methylhydantoinase B
MDALLNYTERRVRQAIADLPEGEYAALDWMDSDGFSDDPVAIAVTVRVASGQVEFDLRECDDQGAGPINATRAMAFAGVAYVLKALIDDDIPVNDGFYRLVSMRTRQGSVVDCVAPAAVGGGWEVTFRVAETAFKALAAALPDRVIAATKGIICNIAAGGRDPRTGQLYAFYETIAGGQGASARRDGMDGVQTHIHNTENAPVEEVELTMPVRIVRFSLIPDSGGAGRYRGGTGVRRDYVFVDHDATVSIVSDRARFAPWGLEGGGSGSLARYVLDPDGAAEALPSKVTVTVAAGRVLSVQTPGGGGFGDAGERDLGAVERDLRLEKVTAEAAARDYGFAPEAPAGARRETRVAR